MKNLPINWQDGMKVNKNHFQGMENAARMEATDNASIRLTSYNYGLLVGLHNRTSCDLFFKLDQFNQVVLSLTSCSAITPGGILCRIDPEQQHLEEFRIPKQAVQEQMRNSKEAALFVLLNTNTFDRIPFGAINQDEDPPRLPFTVPKTYLSIASYSDIFHHVLPNGTSQVIIGRIIETERGLELDDHYIPPVTAVAASEKLLKYFQSWEQFLKNQLPQDLAKTLEKIEHLRKTAAIQGKMDGLGDPISPGYSILKLCTALISACYETIPSFQYLREQPFILLFNAIQQVAAKILAAFSQLSHSNQNILVNYLKEAMKLDFSSQSLLSFIHFSYSHDRLEQAAKACDDFLKLLQILFNQENGLPTKNFEWMELEKEVFTIDEISKPKRVID